MAYSAMPQSNPPLAARGGTKESETSLAPEVVAVLQPIASLKLTVGLLAASIVLVFVGTLAQVTDDMWVVIAKYFDAWFCLVPIQVFFPRSWFPDLQDIPGAFPFLGGKTVGLLMLINLTAAHLIRFKLQAKGREIVAGLGLFAVGVAVTTWVILAGHNRQGLQGKPPISWEAMWFLFLSSMTAGAAALATIAQVQKERPLHQRWMLRGSAILLGIFTLTMFAFGEDFYRDPSKMRILWQLLQAEFASLVLLAGAQVLFRKRAGIVLIHGGIGLLMLGQLLVNLLAVEERMTIQEGETVNYVHDIRAVELAIVDTSSSERDYVVAVPLVEKGSLTEYVNEWVEDSDQQVPPGKTIEFADQRWPFKATVVRFYRNSTLPRLREGNEPQVADAGIGATYTVDPSKKASGTDSDGAVDMATAFVKFESRDGSRDLGTFMLSQTLANMNRFEQLTVDGREFELALRFKRSYKPYAFTLLDVRKDDYPGTTIVRNYQSDLRLADPERKFNDEVKIRMNEPLRYAGETFYQSRFMTVSSGREATELQVVTNTGWMIPYVACMIVGTGMVAHFGFVLSRFLFQVMSGQATAESRWAVWLGLTSSSTAPDSAGSGKKGKAEPTTGAEPDAWWKKSWVLPAATIALFAILVYGLARVPKAKIGTFDFFEFGQLPVQEKGRIKPLDTLARNTLRVLSNRETVRIEPPQGAPADQKAVTIPAIEWLAETIAETERADAMEVFRIENLDVLNLLELPRRKSLRYSVADLRTNIDKFEQAVDAAREKPKEELSPYERKLLELSNRLSTYMLVRAAFRPLPIPPLPSEEEFKRDPAAAEQRAKQIRGMLMSIPQADRQLAAMQPPRSIPVEPSREKREGEAAEEWIPYATAWNRQYLASLLQPDQKPNPATIEFSALIDLYRSGDQEGFNRAVQKYRAVLRDMGPASYDEADTYFESWFNRFAPFFYMMVFYVLVFVITGFGWIFTLVGFSRPLHRVAFWLSVCTWLVHTMAVISRIYISGRPPVTNLYSSAIFIGWGCALAGVVLEPIIRQGIGNALASVAGFITLLIAHVLSLDGDTVAVMVAVLDTQFWLSTHVVCITLGYSATFVAGLLGVAYVLAGLFPKAIESQVGQRGNTPMSLGKMLATATYGVLCFAILFSFVGTVLGGLWADDSWGRFWGWDPKENGALIIVLWNALILHARWDGMIRDRGLAVLSIGGNIVTCWSWFGVNELGVGLHSYGFTEGVLFYLTLTVATHVVFMLLAVVPWLRGKSNQQNQSVAST